MCIWATPCLYKHGQDYYIINQSSILQNYQYKKEVSFYIPSMYNTPSGLHSFSIQHTLFLSGYASFWLKFSLNQYFIWSQRRHDTFYDISYQTWLVSNWHWPQNCDMVMTNISAMNLKLNITSYKFWIWKYYWCFLSYHKTCTLKDGCQHYSVFRTGVTVMKCRRIVTGSLELLRPVQHWPYQFSA